MVAHNGAGASLPAISAPVVPVALPVALVPVETAAPAISGTAQAGQAVDCSQGSWANNPTSYSYSWQRDATAINGATSSSYTLTTADVNQAVTCTVVAHNGSGDSTPAVSAPVVPVALPAPPVETGPPVISGSAEQGQTVSCSTGAWTNGPTSYSYSWQRSASSIAGQTGSTYTLTSADVNQAITCTVVAHNGSGDSAPAASAPIMTIVVKGKRRSTNGTSFRYGLDQAAGVLIEIQQSKTGRVSGSRCLAATNSNARARHCTRWVTVRVLSVRSAHRGGNTYKYLGRIGKGSQLLVAGKYRVYVAAINKAGWSKLRSASFSAVRKLVKSRPAKKPARHKKR